MPPSHPLRDDARRLRDELTPAEVRLWTRLRGMQVEGARFRRQAPIGPYIADFACHAPRIVVEVDGSHHLDRYDRERDQRLRARGYRVLRYWNSDVLKNLDGVVEAIAEAVVAERFRTSAPPSAGGCAAADFPLRGKIPSSGPPKGGHQCQGDRTEEAGSRAGNVASPE